MARKAPGQWQTLTGRRSGKSYVSKDHAKARIKRYRTLTPSNKFRMSKNYDGTKWAVDIWESLFR